MKKTSTFFLVTLLLIFFTFGAFFCLYGTLASPMMEFFQVGTFEQGVITSLNCAGGAAIAVLIALLGERFNKVYGVAAGIGLLVWAVGLSSRFHPLDGCFPSYFSRRRDGSD